MVSLYHCTLKSLDLSNSVLRIFVCPANRSDEEKVTSVFTGDLPGLVDRDGHFSGRVEVRTIAKHDIKQDERCLGIHCFLQDALVTRAMIDGIIQWRR